MVKKNQPAKKEISGSTGDISGSKKAAEALARSEARYRSILEHIQDSYYEVDLAGNFTFVSDSFCANLGYSRGELTGTKYSVITADKDIKPTFLVFNQVYKTGEPNKGFINQVTGKDGEVKYFESSVAPTRNERGDIIGFLCVGRDVTGRRQKEDELRESEERYRDLFAASRDAIMTLEPPTWIFTSGNPATLEMFRAENEADFLSRAPWTLSPELQPDGRASGEKAGEMINTAMREGSCFFEWVHRRINGEDFFADVLLSRVKQDEKIFLHALVRDVTEHKKAKETLQKSEEKYRSLVENINDIFYMLDNRGIITYISPAVERLTMYKMSELVGKPVFPLVHPEDLAGLLESFNHLVSGQLVPWEFRLLDKDGRIIFVRTSRQLLYEDEKVIGITAVMTDITERKLLEQKLKEMATHDFLTGLPNRILLLDRFNTAAALAHRNKARLAVMSLDLDKFKTINDTLGHDAGAQVLKAISKRLTGIIRASDTLARVGGDEFILVMLDTKRREDDTIIAQKILDVFKEPLMADGHELGLSTSIGIAIYPEDAQDLETLTKQSDAAMYYSKGHGRNQFKFFGDGDVGISGDHKSAPN